MFAQDKHSLTKYLGQSSKIVCNALSMRHSDEVLSGGPDSSSHRLTCLEQPEDGVAVVHDGEAVVVSVKYAVVGRRSRN